MKRKFQRKMSWYKIFARSLFVIVVCVICVLLVSCKDGSGAGVTEGAATEDALRAKVEYLNDRISTLEQMLIDQKAETYLLTEDYRIKIEWLEQEISSLLNEKEGEEADKKDESDLPTIKNELTLIYTVSNGKATITGYTGEGETLLIPSLIDGYVVERIADNAFSRTQFRSIEVSEGIKYIGWFAFSENAMLEIIKLPSSLQKADYGIFSGCSAKLRVICESNTYASVYAKSYGISVEFSVLATYLAKFAIWPLTWLIVAVVTLP